MAQDGRRHDGACAWYCAAFDGMPGIGLLNQYRQMLGADVPMFFVRERGNRVVLLVPPSGAKFACAVRASGKLAVFSPCERPSGSEGVQLLFGHDSELAEHFPASASASPPRKHV